MEFKIELPEDTILINRNDLMNVFRELMEEVQLEMDSSDIMTIRETANYLKVSVPTLRNMIAKKYIPYFQKGQVIRIKRSELIKWIKETSINDK